MLKTFLFDLSVAAVFLAMITVLVFAHELGHYLFARLFGMGVEEFAVGFGPRPLCIYGRRTYKVKLTPEQADQWEAGGLRPKPLEGATQVLEAGETDEGVIERLPDGPVLKETTRFTVRLLPLGGFVRIKGMMPEEDGGEAKIPGGFYSHPPIQRLIVLFAGPLFSVLAGLAILVPYLMIVGQPVPDHAPVLGIVAKDGAAAKAGLQKGDRIVSVAGTPTPEFYDIVKLVRDSPDKPLVFAFQRDGAMKTTTVTPTTTGKPSSVLGPDFKPTDERRVQAKIGVGPVLNSSPLSAKAALGAAVLVPIDTVKGLFHDAGHPQDFSDDVGGPVAMVQITADATREGFGQVIWLAAILSISLGIFNLLPFPPLDGGQMVMSFAELVRGGKRLSLRAQSFAITMGAGVVLVLVACVVFIDVHRLFSPSQAGSPPPANSAPKSR